MASERTFPGLHLDAELLAHRLLHVGNNDGRDDAAERLSHGLALCARSAAGGKSGTWPKRIGFNRLICRRLSGLVDFFSLCAITLQWMLERTGGLSVLMNSRSLSMSGALLIAAGVYQLTPLKTACLKQCRAPFSFVALHWRPGVFGAWRMGLEHGLYCVGCCAVLMLLLFVGGIMNLVWIAGLTLFVALEKLAPFGAAAARVAALLLIAAGLALVALG